MTLDQIAQKFTDAGFWVVRKHSGANQDVGVIVISDRSKLEDKQTFYLSIAFSGLEMFQEDQIIDYKLKRACEDYAKVMENYGGFERADICVSTGSPRRKREGFYRQISGLYVPDEGFTNDCWQSTC